MAQLPFIQVRKDLGQQPIVEGYLGGATPLYIERYLYQTRECTVSGIDATLLVTQFGGSRVKEGEPDQWRSMVLPAQSLVIPKGVATHWHYSGTVDYAVFYFLGKENIVMQSLELLAASRDAPISFSDLLVGAASLQLANELQKGPGADQGFMERLAGLMMEQIFRVLTTSSVAGINPRHVHFSRLQVVLNHIHRNLTEALSVPALAKQAGISVAHFRRIFEDATGTPPHRYILAARLEQARKLLTMSTLPIARIAQECGFSSQSHLTAAFRAVHAVTPAEYRKQISRNYEAETENI